MPMINGDDRDLWPYPFGMAETPPWVMPWLAPGPVAQQALAALPFPLRACQTGQYFDAEDFYSEYFDANEFSEEPARKLKAAERSVRDLGNRLEWRLERVWALDDESSPEEVAAYEKAAKSIGGCHIHPRCLDDYVLRAYDLAESIGMHEDNPDWTLEPDPESAEVYRAALDWAQAGVVVLQQSLPWPFTGVLPWAINDNRPAHRALFAYASLLSVKSKRQAKPWFRAMLHMNPMDNMGVRDFL
jgi:hypothetical protein